MDEPSDADLVQRCLSQRGEAEAAFQVLYDRHATPALRLTRALCGDEARARDALQEAALRAWRGLPGFQPGQPFRAWFLGVARHAALDLLRRESTRAGRPWPELLPAAKQAPCALEQAELADLLRSALAALPPELRQACELRQLDGRTHEEVARALGCSLRTAKTRQRQALTLLAQELRQRGLFSPRGEA